MSRSSTPTTELLLTNELGDTTRAVFLSSTEIFATAWNLHRTLANSATEIDWSKGSTWTSTPSALDALFADDFNPFPTPP